MSQSRPKRILFVFALLASIAGCEVIENPRNNAVRMERPAVNVPLMLRQSNWLGNRREGSCVHAAMISLFRWQGRPVTADYWRRAYGNGESSGSMAAKLDCEGIRYAQVTNGDVAFLTWACQTRRGCAIVIRGGAHMVVLVHFDAKSAALLDNNRVDKFIWLSRETLVEEWRASGGWAITPVYTPAAPPP